MRNRLLLGAAVAAGVSIAYIDSSLGWDATGITAFSMFIVAAVLGFFGPQQPWLWALGVGIWIPLHAVKADPSLASAAMVIVLLFPLGGAYAGMALHHLVQRPVRHRP
jgi:hypothetical protein